MEKMLQQQSSNQHNKDSHRTPCSPVDQLGPAVHDGMDPWPREEVQCAHPTDAADVPAPHSPPKTNENNESNEGNLLDGLVLDTPGTLLEDIRASAPPDSEPAGADVTRLPVPLQQALIDIFYCSYYPIFPIIQWRDFQPLYDRWLSARRSDADNRGNEDDSDDSGFSFLLYALLAVAASAMPAGHAIFNQPELRAYKQEDLGDLLYSHATSKCPSLLYQRHGMNAINSIIALSLLSIYLIESGKVGEAWTVVGNAIRLYQSLDLQDGADISGADTDPILATRGNVWWCLYILDCSLSTALSKPLSIDTAEHDLSMLALEEKTDPWFSVIADFHITIGRIYKSVRQIRKSYYIQDSKMWDMLRTCIEGYNIELENYYTKQVLPRIEEPSQRPLALQTIAVSSYYIGVVLLHRTYIECFDVAGPETFLHCAEAASNCIRATPQVITTVPPSHFIIQQGRAVYASVKVLLHCMRLARNMNFNSRAWSDVETGFDMLQKITIQWPQIKKYQELTKEDMHQTQIAFTKHELFHGVFNRYGQAAGKTIHQGDGQPRTTDTTGSPNEEDSSRSATDKGGHGAEPGILSTPKSAVSSSKRCQNWEPNGQQPKRQKLLQDSFLPQSPCSTMSISLNTLSVLREPHDYTTAVSVMGIDDFLLPDFPALPLPAEDLTASFFGDATFDVVP